MANKTCPICKKGALSNEGRYIRCDTCVFSYENPKYDETKTWAKGKSWVFPSLVLAFLIYTALRYITNFDYPIERFANPLSYLDLGIHEVGHLLFAMTGEFMAILGGSLFQILVPVIAIVGLRKEGYYFASRASYIWLGLNLYDVATYAADATARNLPLVTIGGGNYENAHDWYQLLSRTGNLELDNEIAFTLRILGFIAITLGVFMSIRIILRIRSTQ